MIELIIVFVLSFLVTFFSVPYAIESLTKKGLTIPDRYKENKPEVPTQGAVVVLFSAFLVTAVFPLVIRVLDRILQISDMYDLNSLDLAVLLVIAMFGLYGLFDDLVDIGWWSKVLLPICFSFPLLVVFTPRFLIIPIFGSIEISDLHLGVIEDFGINSNDCFKAIIIPIYVMVVANLVNMHSGFNGLQSGLSSILLSTLVLKSIIDSRDENLIPSVAFLGGIIAFWFFNRYPSSIIEGNIGSLTFGAAIGTLIVIKEYYFFGVFILLPHILDFLMLMYLKVAGKPFVKFGALSQSGNIIAPNPFKMKFLLPYYFKLNEKQTVYFLYLITVFVCILGLIFF